MEPWGPINTCDKYKENWTYYGVIEASQPQFTQGHQLSSFLKQINIV